MSAKTPGNIIPNFNPLAYQGIKEKNPPQLYFSNRNPTTTDIRQYDPGDIWINQTSDLTFILIKKTKTAALWEAIGGLGEAPISKYIVDADGTADYVTIQSALDAANASGSDATVYVRAGVYTENLTLYDGINIAGAINDNTIITGTHVPPLLGAVVFQNLTLTSATDIIATVLPGVGTVVIDNCYVNCTNGFIFNMPNWSGAFIINDTNTLSTTCGIISSLLVGINRGNLRITNSYLGAGAATFTIQNNDVTIRNSIIVIGGTFGGDSNVTISDSRLLGTITTADTATVSINSSIISTGANQAITHNSANTFSFDNVSIDSSNNPAVGGNGTIQVGSLDFITDAHIAGTITETFPTSFEAGTAYLQNVSFDRGTTTVANDGELIIGATGVNPIIANLLAGSGIVIANGPGTIQISSTGGGTTWTEVTGVAVAMNPDNGYILNNAGLVTATLPVTCSVGQKIKICGKGAGGWSIAQNAGQQIHFGNQSTTAGVGGSLDSTQQYDQVDLICSVADTEFTVRQAIGNLNVV